MPGKSRMFGDIRLSVAHEDGRPTGSFIEWNELRFHLPQWPSRIDGITESGGHLTIRLKNGQRRYLDASDALLEVSDYGGSEPRPQKKDKPEKPKKKGDVIVSEPKQSAPGNGRGNPYHKPKGSPQGGEFTKKPAEEKGRDEARKEKESAKYADLGIKGASPSELEAAAKRSAAEKAEAASKKGAAAGKKAQREKEEAWEQQNMAKKAKAAGLPTSGEALKKWQRENDIYPSGELDAKTMSAMKRELNKRDKDEDGEGRGSSRSSSKKSRRKGSSKYDGEGDYYWDELVAREEAKLRRAQETDMEDAYSSTRTIVESFDPSPTKQPEVSEWVDADENAAIDAEWRKKREQRAALIADGEAVEVGEVTVPDVSGLDRDDLHDEARELYEESGQATPNGRQHIATAGSVELVRIIQQLRALRGDAESLDEAADSMVKASTHKRGLESDDKPNSNWVEKTAANGRGQLPAYVQHVALALHRERGMPKSQAIGMAIGVIKRWARGGGDVDANTRAAAQKAISEWEALKAKAHTQESAPQSEFKQRWRAFAESQL